MKRRRKSKWVPYNPLSRRLGDIQSILWDRYKGAFTECDAGRDDLKILLEPLSLKQYDAEGKMRDAISRCAPWMAAEEAEQIIGEVLNLPPWLRKPKAETLGNRIGLSVAKREELGIRTIRATGMTDNLMKEQRKAKKRKRAQGKMPREAYLASVTSQQPWRQYGLQKRQYYRRKKAGTLPEPEMTQGSGTVKLLNSVHSPCVTVIAESHKGSGRPRQEVRKRRVA